jgi:hypothetical protein
MESINLTKTVEETINDLWQTHLAEAADEMQQATDLIAFLNDKSCLNTTGFVLRRYLHKDQNICAGELVWPWTDECVDKVSTLLGSQTHINKKDWKAWLSDKRKITRTTVFPIAYSLRMEISDVLELLNAVDGELFNLRSDEEFVHYFFLSKKIYSYESAEKIIHEFRKYAAAKRAEHAVIANALNLGYTQMAQNTLAALIKGTVPESVAQEKLLKFMCENAGQFQGSSLTRVGRLIRFSQYLYEIYPAYYRVDINNKKLKIEKSYFEDVQIDEYGIPNVTDLCYSLMGMDYTLVRETQRDEVVDGIEKFHKNFYSHLRKVFCNITNNGEAVAPVTRKDVLLFAFFFIDGFKKKITPESLPHAQDGVLMPTKLQTIIEGGIWESFDTKVERIMTQLLREIQYPENYEKLEEKKFLLVGVVNDFLDAFDYPPLYAPNPFDRFVLLCLLSECPIGVWSEVLYDESGDRLPEAAL